MTDRLYVALDLETTGLAPESDEIIEIGAIKFDEDGLQKEVFQTLVNPHRPLPYPITRLCDISQQEVDAAPSFSEIASEVSSFLEGCIPVGHNISFDLSFLATKGIALPGPSVDTYDLARLLLPDLSERSLAAVALHLGVAHPEAHRALADARVAKEVFCLMQEKLRRLGPGILQELSRLTSAADGWLGDFITEMAQQQDSNPLLGGATFERPRVDSATIKPPERMSPNSTLVPLDISQLDRFFDADGSLAQTFPGYEQRPEQQNMMRAVAEAFNAKDYLIVEAGTGTGKSMAYLLPAATFAYTNNTPVVISTNTINLQEQLLHKDIPELLGALGSEMPDLQVALLKGRTNYLCLRRWETLRNSKNPGPELIHLLARILVWLPDTRTGDCSELNLDSWEMRFWPRVSAQNYDCLGRRCPYYQQERCFLMRARNGAAGAHLIITNHALLLSEVAAGAQVLPEYTRLIIDEAHHLEDVATSQLGFEIREEDILNHLDQIAIDVKGRQAGFIPQLRYQAKGDEEDTTVPGNTHQRIQSLEMATSKARDRVADGFNALTTLLQDHGEGQGEYDLHLRITTAMRAQPAWTDIEISFENLILALADITKALSGIQSILERPGMPDTLKFEGLSLLNATEELRRQLETLIFGNEANGIQWLTLGRRSNSIGLHFAPLDVGTILQHSFYSQMDTLVLTSATLSTEGHFNYLKGRLGLEDANELLLGTPFDYQSAALIYLTSDIPEPGRAGYQKAVTRSLISLCSATGGRCLVLFTSHAALRATRTAMQNALAQEDILVLGQGVDGSPKKLLSTLCANPRTVLLGAASFWEGVDIVGDALSVLVMVRLPFPVPTDPIFAARSETFDNAFAEYTLPKAAFKFKQGFGRLIRSKTDRGAMVVLDSRLTARNYSPVFLRSLPSCQVQKGPAPDAATAVGRWLEGNL